MTDMTTDRPDILDIAILKGIALQASPLEVLSELSSDHRPVLFKLGPPPTAAPPTKSVIDYKRLTEHLKSLESVHLSQIPDRIESLDEAHAASLHVTNHIIEAIDVCSREMPAGFTRQQLPSDIRELITIKNARRRAHDAWPSTDNRRELWRAQREVKARIKELRDEQWDRKLSELSPSHVAYYKLAKSLKADPVSDTPPLKRPPHPPAFDDIDKAECLADSLESQCMPSLTSIDRPHVQLVESELASLLTTASADEPIPPTTFVEVRDVIKGLHAKKAPGPDTINNKTLKLLPDQVINLLVIIFNTLMAGCSFPDKWKEAIVIGIHKPGKPRDLPTSYRPISLLNTLAKVYERIILIKLKSVVEDCKILNDEQFGFRAKHSCVHQAHRLTEHILKGFNTFRRGAHTGALFFDVAKAFDKVWHDGLIYKLLKLGVPGRLVLLIRNFLSNRTFRYRIDGTLSSPRHIRAGVPQGSVLSPLLFSLYSSDIPKPPHVSVAQFADDTAIYYTHCNPTVTKARLQRAVNDLGQWFTLWRIEVNPEKTVAVVFRKFRKVPRISEISLYNRAIPWSTQAKYLGVTFDNKMRFDKHIRRVRNKAAYVLGRLYPMLCSKSKMSLRHKVTLYKTCIRPIMTYASVAFAHVPPFRLKPLQTLQNKFMRIATGSPWYLRNVDLHRDLRLPTIAHYLKKLSTSYFEMSSTHPNPLVVQSSDYIADRNDPPDKRRPKHVLHDPDDQITTDNAPYLVGPNTPATLTQRLRRRRRGPRFLTSPGRGNFRGLGDGRS